MTLEEETEYGTVHHRCIDPIENFKIKIVLQPIKTLHIPLPQFNTDLSSDVLASPEENQPDIEEYTFKWQEKIFSRSEAKKYSDDHDWKKKLLEKYHYDITNGPNLIKYPSKVFTYIDADNFSLSENDLEIFVEKNSFVSSLSKKMQDLSMNAQYMKHYKNIPKRKIINYYPSEEFKKLTHVINGNLQKMFIMLDLGFKDMSTNEDNEDEHEGILVSLCYDHSNSVLQMTPPFSKSKLRPYTIGRQEGNGRNFYYYWIYHESHDIKNENLTREIQLMTKVFDYQDEIKKLHLDADFFTGKPDHFYMTLYGEIISAEEFEYDNLHIHYFVKVPLGWGFSDVESLIGRTQSCQKNSQGICNFSHLFEMNFFLDLSSQNDSFPAPFELFFEILSVDKYKRYHNEGYTYMIIPNNPGMQVHTLKCWKILNQSRTSQLETFFIGGGPELEDVSYVGLSTGEKEEVLSRFGMKTAPSGFIDVKLSILHQSVNGSMKRDKQDESERSIITNRLDAGSLLGSVNAVLEAFRKARERMLEAKKGLQNHL